MMSTGQDDVSLGDDDLENSHRIGDVEKRDILASLKMIYDS